MAKETDSKGSRSGATIAIGAGMFVALPMLYVLSFGPAVWLGDHGYLDEHNLKTFYFPLILVHDAVPAIGAVLEAYAGLFAG